MVFFFFVCGQHTFRSEVKGYEGVICQCHNCGNMSGRVIKSRPFFTFCFVPLKNRPDVVSMSNGGNSGTGPYPPPANPGWGQQQYQASQALAQSSIMIGTK
ncbi:uncharacterized protein Triagg1_10363 [Trichoderma aggressivum f. europaeum]|uniref:Uncharacterized protein n=1 Tax=Trichoderma aggressivum f. europaeum TaxID=173218 RepID=A0AAE1I951_9HYPO|nr:hypothetical protein Triagg1_10363 [Trichoderma aggressivum f. europaeum]